MDRRAAHIDWDYRPRQFPGLLDEELKPYTQCIGTTLKGRRCKNPSAGGKYLPGILRDVLAADDPSLMKLKEIAKSLLCRRWHQIQAEGIASTWLDELKPSSQATPSGPVDGAEGLHTPPTSVAPFGLLAAEHTPTKLKEQTQFGLDTPPASSHAQRPLFTPEAKSSGAVNGTAGLFTPPDSVGLSGSLTRKHPPTRLKGQILHSPVTPPSDSYGKYRLFTSEARLLPEHDGGSTQSFHGVFDTLDKKTFADASTQTVGEDCLPQPQDPGAAGIKTSNPNVNPCLHEETEQRATSPPTMLGQPKTISGDDGVLGKSVTPSATEAVKDADPSNDAEDLIALLGAMYFEDDGVGSPGTQGENQYNQTLGDSCENQPPGKGTYPEDGFLSAPLEQSLERVDGLPIHSCNTSKDKNSGVMQYPSLTNSIGISVTFPFGILTSLYSNLVSDFKSKQSAESKEGEQADSCGREQRREDTKTIPPPRATESAGNAPLFKYSEGLLVQGFVSSPTTRKREPYKPRTAEKTYAKAMKLLKTPLTEADKTRVGHIYVYTLTGYTGQVKIGLTTWPVETRMNQWRLRCKQTPQVIYPKGDDAKIKTPHLKKVEQLIHEELHSFRFVDAKCSGCGCRHKEWFEVRESHALDVIRKWESWMRTSPYDVRTGQLVDRSEETLKRLCQWTPVPQAPKASRRRGRDYRCMDCARNREQSGTRIWVQRWRLLKAFLRSQARRFLYLFLMHSTTLGD